MEQRKIAFCVGRDLATDVVRRDAASGIQLTRRNAKEALVVVAGITRVEVHHFGRRYRPIASKGRHA
jgi:hypothetical protein